MLVVFINLFLERSIMKQQLYILYGIIILLTAFYLFAVEGMGGGNFYFNAGGRDNVFSFFDVTLFLVLIFSAALTVVSLMAYGRKKSERLFFVSFAFFLFTLKSGLRIIDNFIVGGYGYIGISVQTLEFLILLSLFYALFRK